MRQIIKGRVFDTDHRFTVRPRGATAWGTAPTLAKARELARQARGRGLDRVVIVDEETGEVVT